MEAILDSADAYRSPVLFLLKVLSRQELPVKRLVIDELGIADIIVPDPDLFRRYLAALTEFDDESLADVHLFEELTAEYITDDGLMNVELCEEDGFISWRRLSAGAR